MARFNEILAGRYSRFSQKLFGMKGGPPTPQLAGDIQVGIPLFSGREHRYLEGWQSFAFGVQVGPVAAQLNLFRIRNPLGSNVVAVVERMASGNVAADSLTMFHGVQNADLATVQNPLASRLDPRGQQNPTCALSVQSAASVFGSTGAILLAPANSESDLILTDIHEMPLLPGDAIQIQNGTVNVLTSFTIQWRERFLEEPERI